MDTFKHYKPRHKVVKAVQYDGSEEMNAWILNNTPAVNDMGGTPMIGTSWVWKGDWVVCDSGNWYVMSFDVFRERYEEV